jgi:DNA-binding MarR family transcriptional regulator
LQDEIAQLREEITSLEAAQDTLSDNQLIQLRLIHELKDKSNGPTDTEKERVERIEKLCSDAPNHEISLSELRGRLGIDKAVLSRLLKRINGDKFYLRKSTLDKRIRYLCLRPKVR